MITSAAGRGQTSKAETRSYVRDITPDLLTLLQLEDNARQQADERWAEVLSRLPRCEIVINIAAGENTSRKIDANEILENRFGLFTHERVQSGLPQLAQSLLVILTRAGDGLACQKECSAKLREFQTAVGEDVVEEIKATFASLHATQQEVLRYRMDVGARVFKGVVLIAGTVAHAAASWGAASPLALVPVARECIGIAQIVGKGLAEAGHIGELVSFDLKTIQTFYTNRPSAGTLQNDAVEIISRTVSRALAIEIPNLENCRTHIGDFDHKVDLLDIDHTKMGEKLAKLRDEIATGQTSTKTSDQLIARSGVAYSALFEEVPRAKSIVDSYRKMSKDWRATLSSYEKQTSPWTKHVSTLAGTMNGLSDQLLALLGD